MPPKILMVLGFLFSAHPLMVVHICTKFGKNIFHGFEVTEQTQFSSQKFQRGLIPQKVWWGYGSFSLHIV